MVRTGIYLENIFPEYVIQEITRTNYVIREFTKNKFVIRDPDPPFQTLIECCSDWLFWKINPDLTAVIFTLSEPVKHSFEPEKIKLNF